jgi:hypothetical protein
MRFVKIIKARLTGAQGPPDVHGAVAVNVGERGSRVSAVSVSGHRTPPPSTPAPNDERKEEERDG